MELKRLKVDFNNNKDNRKIVHKFNKLKNQLQWTNPVLRTLFL